MNKVHSDYCNSSSLSKLLPPSPTSALPYIFCFVLVFLDPLNLTRILCVAWNQHWSLEPGGLLVDTQLRTLTFLFPEPSVVQQGWGGPHELLPVPKTGC